MIPDNVDQTLTVNPCNLRYVYQGMDPNATDPYNFLPWRRGLLTQTKLFLLTTSRHVIRRCRWR